jgi:hypothetical protein
MTTDPTSSSVTLSEAARLVGRSERAIRKRIERGTLRSWTEVRGGRAVAVVSRDELLHAVGDSSEQGPEPSGTPSGTSEPTPQLGTATVELLRLQLEEAVREVEQLKRELSASATVERNAVRFADRAEARVEVLSAAKAEAEQRAETARRELLSVVHQLGKVEGERDRLLQLTAPRKAWWTRVLGR